MTGAVDPADLLAGLEPLVLAEGQHVRGVVVIALVEDVNVEREASLHIVSTPDTSYWLQLGMLLDATDGLRTPAWRNVDGDL